jgi:acetyl esterase/lipase
MQTIKLFTRAYKTQAFRLLTFGIAILMMVTLISACATPASTTPTPGVTPIQSQNTGQGQLPASGDQNGLPGGGMPSAFSVTPTQKDLAYETGSNPQVLDLYVPTTGSGPFPVVINIHGGGFKMGDKGMLSEATGKALLNAGYAVASINYRLSGDAKFPAAVQDAKAAVRFLRANAAKYNLNPDKIAVFGQSAGGNLAAMVGVTGNIADFDDTGLGNSGVSSKVQAVIDWFGPTDFLQMDAQAKAQGCSASDQTHNDANSFESLYIGAAIQSVPDQVKKSNPIPYISKDTPPFLIQKGDQDCTVPIENTKMLADALSAQKLDVQYALLKNVGHGDSMGTSTPVFESESNLKLIIDFLNTKLGVK